MAVKRCFILAATMCAVMIVGCNSEKAETTTSTDASNELVVLTPHNQGIQNAFELGFRSWYLHLYKKEIKVRWLVYGTPQCMKYVENCHKASGELAPSFAPDVLFGGSMRDHLRLQKQGWTIPIELDARDDVPESVAGIPSVCPDNSCVATGLSTFGMLVNAQACRERGIEPPSTWKDLAEPRFYGWLAIADPGRSGTSRQCFMLILQKYGWEEGWSLIMRILGNARTLVARSRVALSQVESGESLVTFAINFDAMARAEHSSYELTYVEPEGATQISPDGVSALATSRNKQGAAAFVNFLVSKRGQQILGLRADYLSLNAPTLFHYPISQSIYDEESDRLAVGRNPLKTSAMMETDEKSSVQQEQLLPLLVSAACGRQHIALQQLWAAVQKQGNQGAARDALFRLPMPEDGLTSMAEGLKSAHIDEVDQMQAQLIAKMREIYDSVGELVGG